MLADDPANLRARWLLNVAHMTLGQYPAGVPAAALIPPAAFASQHALPRFPNVAGDVGLDVHGLSGGAILDDFDRDGRLDLMLSAIGFEDPMKLFRLRDDGRYEDTAAAAGLTGLSGGLNMLQADFDNDGWTDVLVLRGGWMGREARFPPSLLRNDGDGTFTDVTEKAGLMRAGPTQTAVFLDYDGDGDLDLYVGYESEPANRPPLRALPQQRRRHLHRRGGAGRRRRDRVRQGRRQRRLRPRRPARPLPLGRRRRQRALPQRRPAGGRPLPLHERRPPPRAFREPQNSFPAAFFDYDNDGWPDIFVAAYDAMAEDVAADLLGLPTDSDRGRLYRNRGDGTFADVTREAGLYRVTAAMGLNYGDLDGDGFLDLYIGTGNPDLSTLVPNLMFRNDAGRRFQDVTTAVDAGHLQKGHGIAFGDVDDDGDQDVFEEMGGAVLTDRARSALYRNPGNANAFVGLELEGVRANRSALGARVAVTVDTETGPRTFHRTVGSGGSFGASPLRLDIGLGAARRIRAVEIVWPGSGLRQAVDGLSPGRRYRVREGEPAREVKRVPIHLAAE